jgi:hypothetical protein
MAEELTVGQKQAIAIATARLRLAEQGGAPVQEQAPPNKPSFRDITRMFTPDVKSWRDAAGGAIRGPGSIGATLMAPHDALNAALLGTPMQDRRTAMDDVLAQLGSDPDSALYKGTKFGTEMAGTGGMGKLLAGVLQRAGLNMPGFLKAVETFGARTGANPTTKLGKVADVATRSAGGGLTGLASSGAIDYSTADEGAAISAILPVVGSPVRAAASLVRPNAARSDLARKAIDAGIPLGASDVSSNQMVKAARSFLDDTILIGRIGQNRKDAVQKGFNKAVGEKFGANADSLTPDVVDRAKATMGAEFDRLWNRNNLTFDTSLDSGLQALRNNASKLPKAEKKRLLDWINDFDSRKKLDASGNLVIPGDEVNRLQSALRKDVESATGFLKNDLNKLRSEVLSAFNRGISPADVQALGNVRGQYKAFKTVEPLLEKAEAGVAGRDKGDVPAALLPEAVRQSYGSRISSSPFADLSQIGSQFVADRVARTGGSARAAVQNFATGAGVGIGAWHNPPAAATAAAAAAALEAALSSPTLARSMLLRHQGQANPFLEFLYRSAPVVEANRNGQ